MDSCGEERHITWHLPVKAPEATERTPVANDGFVSLMNFSKILFPLNLSSEEKRRKERKKAVG